MSRTRSAKKAKTDPAAIESIFDEGTTVQSSNLYCICRKPDVGTPMVHCGLCKDWFHFECVSLNEFNAEDIKIFVCPPCSVKTGRYSLMTWDPSSELEIYAGGQPMTSAGIPAKTKKKPGRPKKSTRAKGTPNPTHPKVKHEPEHLHPSEATDSDKDEDDEADMDSGDEEFVIGGKHKGRKRPQHPDTSDSDSEPDSPTAPRIKKRRQSTLTAPPAKRKKVSSPANAADDVVRKFCLDKLQSLFRGIFLRYPRLPDGTEKKPDELTEEEKESITRQADEFTSILEASMYEGYNEPDKDGEIHAGSKYKDRFRMLQFNLSKSDRVILHKRIASHSVTPQALSSMSSTELADEATQKSIKEMEKAALDHSTLQRNTLTRPVMKITHKGFEAMDDSVGRETETSAERARELEEEEQRTKERQARFKAAQEQKEEAARRRASISSAVTPSSPLDSHSPWATSSLSMTTPEDASAALRAADNERPPLNPLFAPTHTLTDMLPIVGSEEPELNLADLINIDDEPTASSGASATVETLPTPLLETVLSPPSSAITSSPTITQEKPASFDLNSLWTGSIGAKESPEQPEVKEDEDMSIATSDEQNIAGPQPPPEVDDLDFDMILNDKEEKPNSELTQQAFSGSPSVWTGKLLMPIDSVTPDEAAISARQVGGRILPVGSPLWSALFPSRSMLIEGRVPVDKSRDYLMSMRMTSSKELIAVAFSAEEGGETVFGKFIDFLIGKSRHGLIFPWGPRAKDPGRELYMVPLLSTQPIPDFIDLLDDQKMPKNRTVNYIVGIWILNRGKLVPPPPAPLLPAPPPLPSPSSSTPPMPPPSIPTLPISLPTVHTSTLAAEVASLTPEQVQLMMRSLSQSGFALGQQPAPYGGPSPQPSGPWQPSPPRPPQHPRYGGPPPTGPSAGGYSGYQQPPHQGFRGRGGGGGWRGGRGGDHRGRGRGGGDGERPRDGGWPRR